MLRKATKMTDAIQESADILSEPNDQSQRTYLLLHGGELSLDGRSIGLLGFLGLGTGRFALVGFEDVVREIITRAVKENC